MNYKNWLAKYYPIPADEIEGTDIELIDHAILKWKGLLDLAVYNLYLSHRNLCTKGTNRKILTINGDSCSLCIKYYKKDDDPCEACPLAKSLGHPCDRENRIDETLYWQALRNPQLMINALLEARKMAEYEGFTSDYVISQIDDSDD